VFLFCDTMYVVSQKGKTAFQLTSYEKVKEVLSGHAAGSGGGRVGHSNGAAIPRYARGTGMSRALR
jgi:hypothetical protein